MLTRVRVALAAAHKTTEVDNRGRIYNNSKIIIIIIVVIIF